jgi:methylmalonyl-CoA mutase N-terminal domain/subunit
MVQTGSKESSDQAAWLRRHAEEFAQQRKESFTTSSSREVRAVYTPEDLPAHWYRDAIGLPGEPPWTRGETATGYRGELWGWEFYAGFGSAKEANARYRYLLEQGSTGGVSIALDLPTQIGMDADHRLAVNETGKVGVALNTIEDVFALFDGIDLESAHRIFTTANCIGPIAFAWFWLLCEHRGIDPQSIVVTIQNDPLKEYVARGTQFLPVPASARLAADVVEHCTNQRLPWLPISVSGSHMKQAGGTCVHEAAFTLANAVCYADELHRRGVAASEFAPRMELHFCTDMDFFEEIAKYRVIRRVWGQLLRDRYGAPDVAPRLHAATSGLPLTAQQPKNNIIRITLQALAQILGGVAQTRTASYDEALAIPTEDAVKLSIRTNQIIAYETGIADIVDPLGGSWYLERLTLEMFDEVQSILQRVEKMGGALVAVESGWFATELADSAYRQQEELERGDRVVVGINRFVEDDSDDIKLFTLNPEAAMSQRRRLAEFKARREPTRLADAMNGLRTAVREGRNCVPLVIEAVRVGATVGEISDLWRQEFGEYHSQAQWIT